MYHTLRWQSAATQISSPSSIYVNFPCKTFVRLKHTAWICSIIPYRWCTILLRGRSAHPNPFEESGRKAKRGSLWKNTYRIASTHYFLFVVLKPSKFQKTIQRRKPAVMLTGMQSLHARVCNEDQFPRRIVSYSTLICAYISQTWVLLCLVKSFGLS